MEIENSTYQIWLESIKVKIRSAQLKASVAVNSELLEVYWELGKEIVQKQNDSQYGDAILDQLSFDLRLSFPNIKGFSKRNLYSIRQWYLFYNQKFTIVPQVVAQLPWGHNRLLISKTKDIKEALFYAVTTIENGWSRDQLEIQIKNKYFQSKGGAINNFDSTLPQPQSQLAIETIRNPYNFDFLGLENHALERELKML